MKKYFLSSVILFFLLAYFAFAVPAVNLVSPTLSANATAFLNWTYINITSSENLTQALLEWGNTTGFGNFSNVSMTNSSGGNLTWWINMTNLIDGTYNYTIWAKNSSGNWSQSERRFVIIDTVAPYNISACQDLTIENGSYVLAQKVSSAGTCFNILANNITLDGAGYAINYSQSAAGYAINNTGHNYTAIKNTSILQENASVGNAHAIYIENSNNVIIANNSITTSSVLGSGIYIRASVNTAVSGGSVISKSGYEYYLQNISTTNNFTSTNFTAARKIYFYDTASYFNYNNGSAQNIWLKTNVSAQGNITRTLANWNNTLMQWNDTNSTAGLIANYIITGLQATGTYKVYNTSAGARTNPYSLTPDSSGTLPSFQIALGGNTEIIVNYSAPYVAPATCSDGIKNQDETGIDCGGSCSACVSGGGGGNETSSIKTITQTGIEPLKKVSVSFKTSLNNPHIKMEKLSETPVRVPVDTVYQYLNITKANFNNSDIENATIEFKVSKAWINSSGISRMYLARYNEGWVKLRTDLTDSSGDFNTYLAYTDGFSYFAIAGEPAGQAVPSGANNNAVVPIAENNSTNNQSAAQGEQNTTAIKKDAASGLTWLLIIVAAIIFTCIYAYISYGGNKKPVPENIIGEKQKSDSVESAPPSKNSEETEELAPGTAFSDIYEEAETDYLSKRIQEARRKLKSD